MNTTVAVLTLLAGVAALKNKFTVVGDGCRACNIDGIGPMYVALIYNTVYL